VKLNLQALLQDASLARHLVATASLAEAGRLVSEAAAARGWRLGRKAVRRLLAGDAASPRELSAAELLAVGGGTKTRNTAAQRSGFDVPDHEWVG